ncbi:MAG TPA: hypothetical protein VJ914_01630 [Pseudonocardiaceae bacterium]|nr:hypothetical protein [Pseudonocardiaceae bacterium]
MDGYAQPSQVSMPGRLKWALAFAYIQVVANLGFGLLLSSSINDAVSHGEELANPGLAYFAEYFSYIAAAAILVAAIVITTGRTWGRNLLAVFEGLAIINGVVTLVQGTPSAVLGIALGAVVIATLFHVSVRNWFESKEALRNQA